MFSLSKQKEKRRALVFKLKLGQTLHVNVVENAFRLNIRKRQYQTFNQEMKLINVPSIGENLTFSSKIPTEMFLFVSRRKDDRKWK